MKNCSLAKSIKRMWNRTYVLIASPGWTGHSSIGWVWLVLAADWPAAEASETGEEREPAGLPGESGPFTSAVLVVAVMGRWGILMATGAVCSWGKSLGGGDVFPWTDSECSASAVTRQNDQTETSMTIR